MEQAEVVSLATQRQGLRRTLAMWSAFRTLLRIGYVFIPVVVVVLLVQIATTARSVAFTTASLGMGMIVGLELILLLLLGLGGWFIWGFRPYIKATLRVEEAELTLMSGGKEERVDLREVESIRFRQGLLEAIRWPGQAMLLKLRDGRDFVVPHTFQRLDYVTDTLAVWKPELAAGPTWAKRRASLVALDHGLARLNDQFKRPMQIVFVYACLPFLLAFAATSDRAEVGSWQALALGWVGLIFMSLYVGLILQLATDRYLSKKLHRQLSQDGKELRREMDLEKRLAILQLVVHVVLLTVPVLLWVLIQGRS